MARPWSARCYGVARQREGSRQNSIGGSGVLSLRHFSGWFSLSLGAWVPKKLARRRMVSAGAMLLDRLGPPGFRFNDFRAPALTYLSALRAREGAAGQAVVCPLLRGSSPTRGVAPQQHRGLRRAFSPAFRAGSLYPLARGCRRSWRGEIWFRRRDAARPARAAWAVQRLLAARWRGRRRRRRRFRFIDFRGRVNPFSHPYAREG